MRKSIRALVVILCSVVLIFSLSLTGCKKEEKQETKVVTKSEGQMEGVLVSFEGKTLVIEAADKEYTFDVSNASINTKNMRAGDDIVVYFEGKLEGQDTSKVKVTRVEDLGENEHQTEKQAVGTLVDLTENTITIRQNDGVELLFNSNNCQHEFKNGIREGNWIVVTYIGNINGTDTKNVTVIKITDNDPNTVKEEQKKMNIKAVNETVYATAGVHIRASYTTDSNVLGSLAKGEAITRTGVCDNGWSRVQYASKDAYIYGEYLTTEKPKEDAPTEQQPEEQTPQEQTLMGTVLAASMNTLTVASDGQEYTFNVADAEHEYANGVQTGNTVKVIYVGSLDDLENLVGMVVDATMNTLTIQTEDGAVMTFLKEDAVDNLNGDYVGMDVKVTADMTASEADENIFQAKQIDPADMEQ